MDFQTTNLEEKIFKIKEIKKNQLETRLMLE